MLIPRAWFVPDLPTLLMDEHRGHHTVMLGALAQVSERLREASPQAVVVVSGRWETAGPFVVDASRRHATLTDYQGFGVEVRYDCKGHPALARALVEAGQKAGVRVAPGSRGADSGVSVPMHFLRSARDLPVVPLSVATRPRRECRAWGAAVRAVLAAWPEPVALVVGGVLANNEHAWNLRREVPEARGYDDRMMEALSRGAWEELWTAPRGMLRLAQPDVGLRHLAILRGFLGADSPGRTLCYEPGPGRGAALLEFDVAEPVAE
jgi:aromatic ring-opening dioxygenase catalytic subunit (LigB family)